MTDDLSGAGTAPPPRDDPRLLELCARALALAERGHFDRAARVVERISRAYPADGVTVAALAWCDAVVAHVPDLAHATVDSPIGLQFAPVDHAGVFSPATTADEVPPAVRWAGRFLSARVRMDFDQGRALWEAPESDEQFSECVLALLEMVALMRSRSADQVFVQRGATS